MSLERQEIDPEVDFPALARCMFDSYEDPPQKFFHIFFPTHGEGHEHREEAIKEAAERLKLWNTEDSTSRWQKVIDTTDGRIVGGALWNIHPENPFREPKPPTATWFPEGGSRTFAIKAIQRHARPRSKVAQGPHFYLFILFTHPDYRRKGVAQQLLDWGIGQADSFQADIYLDATEHGQPFYERNGFEYMKENVIIPETEDPDDSWREIQEKVGPFTFWLMRRHIERYTAPFYD